MRQSSQGEVIGVTGKDYLEGVAIGVDGEAPVHGQAQPLPHALDNIQAANVAVLQPWQIWRATAGLLLPYLHHGIKYG